MQLHDWAPALAVLAQVLVIDLVLAGDNAVVIGLAVNGLKPEQRRVAIWAGIAAATLIRIALALVAVRLLQVLGLTLAGGILLLWVVWKSFRELSKSRDGHVAAKPVSLNAAILRIVVADLSMSLDNVVAVAGAAHAHPYVLVVGLLASIGFMGAGATLVAALLERYRWVAWIGLAIVLYVAGKMIYEGGFQVFRHFVPG